MVRAHCAIEERIPVGLLTEKLLAHRVVHRCVPFDFYEHSGYFLFFDIRRMVPIGCNPPLFYLYDSKISALPTRLST